MKIKRQGFKRILKGVYLIDYVMVNDYHAFGLIMENGRRYWRYRTVDGASIDYTIEEYKTMEDFIESILDKKVNLNPVKYTESAERMIRDYDNERT